MRHKIRTYLIENTPVTKTAIPDGELGEFSKITEEYHELKDALDQNLNKLSYIESLDLMEATIRFQNRKFWIPAPVSYIMVLLRRIYKPLRNRVYEYAGLDKADFNS